MARCYYSGVERPLSGCRKLNTSRAQAELRRLRRQLAALETVVERLGVVDREPGFDAAGQLTTRYLFRLVCPEIAETLEQVTGCEGLFETWAAWQERRRLQAAARQRQQRRLERSRRGRRYKTQNGTIATDADTQQNDDSTSVAEPTWLDDEVDDSSDGDDTDEELDS